MTSVKKKIDIIFEGRNEVLEIVDTGGELVKKLVNEKAICPLIGSEIKFGKRLGKGTYGAVFLIKIQGTNEKKYVAKKMEAKQELIEVSEQGTLQEIAKKLHKKYFIIEEEFIAINGGNPKKRLSKGEEVILPIYSKICRLPYDYYTIREDNDRRLTIPKGSYLCDNEQYSEYVLGILAGNFYRSGKSINFLDVFNFSTCEDKKGGNVGDKKDISQYIFMEKIDNTLAKIMKCIDEDFMTSVIVQTLHALACLQTYKIVHNDLYLRNVFVEYVTEETKFNGQTLHDADYYRYSIDGTDLYVPMSPFIVKIGDFGLSFKWSSPIVGNKAIVDRERLAGILPNWFTPNYDFLIFISQLFLNSKVKYPFLIKICSWVFRGEKSLLSTQKDNLRITSGIIDFHAKSRPLSSMVDKTLAVPKDILTNKKLMGNLMKRPKGKIVTLGKI